MFEILEHLQKYLTVNDHFLDKLAQGERSMSQPYLHGHVKMSCILNKHYQLCLFDLILYVPVNTFSVMSGLVYLGWTSAKQG